MSGFFYLFGLITESYFFIFSFKRIRRKKKPQREKANNFCLIDFILIETHILLGLQDRTVKSAWTVLPTFSFPAFLPSYLFPFMPSCLPTLISKYGQTLILKDSVYKHHITGIKHIFSCYCSIVV